MTGNGHWPTTHILRGAWKTLSLIEFGGGNSIIRFRLCTTLWSYCEYNTRYSCTVSGLLNSHSSQRICGGFAGGKHGVISSLETLVKGPTSATCTRCYVVSEQGHRAARSSVHWNCGVANCIRYPPRSYAFHSFQSIVRVEKSSRKKELRGERTTQRSQTHAKNQRKVARDVIPLRQ